MTDTKGNEQFWPNQWNKTCDIIACQNTATRIAKSTDLSGARFQFCSGCWERKRNADHMELLRSLDTGN